MFERRGLEDLAQAKLIFESIFDKFYRSRRKTDINNREQRTDVNLRSSANNSSGLIVSTSGMGTTNNTMGNVYSSCENKKTGLINCSKVNTAKISRKKAGNQLTNEQSLVDSFDNEVIDKICAIPLGLDKNEWLATHTLELFEQVNALCGTISEVCTPVSCSTMTYPNTSKANWIDEKGKRHNYSAMRYIDSVMSFCEASRTNQQIFPTKFGATFGNDFDSHCRRMIRYMWHCCGHIYSKHWDYLNLINLQTQFGLVLSHLAKIGKMYNLFDPKELIAIHATLRLVRPLITFEEQEKKNTEDETSSTSCSQDNLYQHEEQPRPAKRLNSGEYKNSEERVLKESKNFNKYASPNHLQTTSTLMQFKTKISLVEQTPISLSSLFWQTNYSLPTIENSNNQGFFRIPTMKSGSWGGHSAIVACETSEIIERAATGSVNNTGFKNFAQIC